MNMNRDGRVFKLDVCKTFDNLYEMSNPDDDCSIFGLDVCKTFDDLYEKANASDDGMFEFDVSRRFDDLFESANESEDIFDNIGRKMESLLYLRIVKQEPVTNCVDDLEGNKENVAPDQFINYPNSTNVYKLRCSTKKLTTPKLHNTHSITTGEIKMELPRTKNSMITGLHCMKNIATTNSHIRPVVKSQYKYEHVKSGSKVFRSRNFSSEFEQNTSSNNTDGTINSKQIKNENDCKQIKKYQNLNSSIQSNGIKMHGRSQKIKVFNAHDGIMKNKEIGHDGIKVFEKQRHTITKPFSFEFRKSSTVKPQNVENTEEKQWTFKARPATVLKVKPFIPKHEKKCTEPKNIYLNTERRAQDWIVFDEEKKKKNSQYEEMIRMRQSNYKRREIELRQKTIHKPEPIKKYKPILIQKSGKPLTIPRSPRLSYRSKIHF